MNKLGFYKLDTKLPEFKEKYVGYFVMDNTNSLYIGLPTGWEKIGFETDLSDYSKKDMFVKLTQSEYDVLVDKNKIDENKIYFII